MKIATRFDLVSSLFEQLCASSEEAVSTWGLVILFKQWCLASKLARYVA